MSRWEAIKQGKESIQFCPYCGKKLWDSLYDDHIKYCPTCGAAMREMKPEWITETQDAKADSGKPRLSLVPRQIIWDIAKVREYGTKKYGDSNNWIKVQPERYRDALFRHFMAYLDDPYGVDAESGLPHLAHIACNVAFLCEMQGGKK